MKRLIAALALAALPATAQDARVDGYVLSNAEHTLWHEIGHALISEFELAVLGQEEVAVDAFATVMMLSVEGEDRVEPLLDVAELWLISHDRAEAAGGEPDYFGEHDLDAQRGLRVICFLAGEGPGRAQEMVEEWGLPGDRAETCEDDFHLAVDSWDQLLTPHLLPSDQEPAEITVRYGEGGEWEAWLRHAELLEAIADELSSEFDLMPGLVIEAASCDEANAFWDPERRTVTLWYELLDFYADLAEDAAQ